MLEFLRDALFADPTKAFNPDKSLKSPDQWPEDLKKLVTSYNAGTVTAAEKITFGNRIDLAFKLLDELRPVWDRRPAVKHVQLNVENLMAIVSRGASPPS